MHLRRFPFERSLELAIDFFKQFDDEIYNFFMDLISSPRFVLIDDGGNLEGWSLKRNYLVDSYTVLVPQYFISDFTTIIHETMHSYNQFLQNLHKQYRFFYYQSSSISFTSKRVDIKSGSGIAPKAPLLYLS